MTGLPESRNIPAPQLEPGSWDLSPLSPGGNLFSMDLQDRLRLVTGPS